MFQIVCIVSVLGENMSISVLNTRWKNMNKGESCNFKKSFIKFLFNKKNGIILVVYLMSDDSCEYNS